MIGFSLSMVVWVALTHYPYLSMGHVVVKAYSAPRGDRR